MPKPSAPSSLESGDAVLKPTSTWILGPPKTSVQIAQCCPRAILQQVSWALDASSASIQHMRRDHRRADISMAKQLLNGADVVASFEQVGGERMAKSLAARSLGKPCLPYSFSYSPLQYKWTDMMPPFSACTGVNRTLRRRKYILPTPFTIDMRILSLQAIW
jgi:hypothetical protein